MRWIPLPTVVLTLLMSAIPVLAQTATKAPSTKSISSQPWAVVLASFFLLILVGVGSFMSSKRSHQD